MLFLMWGTRVRILKVGNEKLYTKKCVYLVRERPKPGPARGGLV